MAGLNREHIGLKYVWKDTKGWSLRSKFRVLKEELRMAFQRAWNGVDEDDSYECFMRFRMRMLIVLEQMKKSVWFSLNVPAEVENYDLLGELDEDSYGARYFNLEDATCIFDIMIFHLNMMDEEYAGRVALETHPGLKENSSRYLELVHHLNAQNKEQFMHLFNLFYYQLWL